MEINTNRSGNQSSDPVRLSSTPPLPLRAGHRVTVYNRNAQKCLPLLEQGARQAISPAAAAEGSDIVISIVTDSPDVEAVLLGEHGAVHGAKKGALFIDMSTIAPAWAQKIGNELFEKGVSFLDAPVTGGDVGAKNGTLSILVGGKAEDLRPYFLPGGRGAVVNASRSIIFAFRSPERGGAASWIDAVREAAVETRDA